MTAAGRDRGSEEQVVAKAAAPASDLTFIHVLTAREDGKGASMTSDFLSVGLTFLDNYQKDPKNRDSGLGNQSHLLRPNYLRKLHLPSVEKNKNEHLLLSV